MVQYKNPQPAFDLMDILRRAKERLGTPKETRYVVIEVTPGSYDNQWDKQWPDTSRRVYVASRLKDISDWQDEHEPDPGNHFDIFEETLYERTVTEWHLGKLINREFAPRS